MVANRGRPKRDDVERYPNNRIKPVSTRMQAAPSGALPGLISQSADPLGRAYAAGLLGDQGMGKVAAGRLIHWQYWRQMYDLAPEFRRASGNCLGRLQPFSTSGRHETDVDREQRLAEEERRLNQSLTTIGKLGRDVRAAFDELVIDPVAGDNPGWLDRLLANKPTSTDRHKLALAVRGLDALV